MASAVNDYVEATYLPGPPDERGGVALCLSGGGYRAVMFEIGALRRLNELGLLSRVDTLTAVSAGSFVLAQLARSATHWPAPGSSIERFDDLVAAPLERLVRRNLRTAPMVARLIRPWRWLDDTARIDHLQRLFARYLTDQRLADLAGRQPRYVFVATDNAFATTWEASGERLGSPAAGYASPGDWPVARAVAASCSFPPAFEPLRARLDPDELFGGSFPRGPERDRLISDLRLSDGGAYDELAVEPVWRDHAVLLSIDAGSIYPPAPEHGFGRTLQLLRKQIVTMRKRWLISGLATRQFEGAYLGLASHLEHYGVGSGPYSPAFIDEVLARIRTDFDALHGPEIAALQNHGYLVADAAAEAHLRHVFPLRSVPRRLPYPAHVDEHRLREELADSGQRTFLVRGGCARYVFA